MAEVFEAELCGAHGFFRRVAIKKISAQLAGEPGAAARFLEEARIASSLHHAGIVAVLDFGVMDGAPFQVLELVEGMNADQLIDRIGEQRGAAGLPTEVALAIAAELARALHHAHQARDATGLERGIVHRDVKPSNALLSWSGDIKLTDFGIAFARDRAIQTETGVTPGSWAFMAPEQRGRGAVDRRADVFALGCTLHALLTGESPQRDLEAAIAVATGRALSLSPSLDQDVAALIARAVAPAAAARFATAEKMAEALEAALAERSARTPRRMVEELLGSLREAEAPRRGLLDQLLAVELVLTAEVGELREFELRRAPTPTPTPSSAGARGVLARRLALMPVIAGALTFLFWQRTSLESAERAEASRRSAAAETSPVLTSPADEPAPTPAVRFPDTPLTEANRPDVRNADSLTSDPAAPSPSPSPSPAAAPPPRRARPTREPAAPPPGASSTTPDRPLPGATFAPAAPTSSTSPSADSVGYLKVIARDRADARLVNARVYIDGELRGYSPDPIRTTVGPHKIRVVLADDTTEIGTYTLEVKADHRDRGHPATLRVP